MLTAPQIQHTPRDHVLTALVTIGEGYHNFVSVPNSSPSFLRRSDPRRSTAPRVPARLPQRHQVVPVRPDEGPGSKSKPDCCVVLTALGPEVAHLAFLESRPRLAAQGIPRQRDQEGSLCNAAQEIAENRDDGHHVADVVGRPCGPELGRVQVAPPD